MFLVYHFIIGSVVCTRSPAEAPKGYEKFQLSVFCAQNIAFLNV